MAVESQQVGMEAMPESGGEGEPLPMSLLAGNQVKPGDVVKLEVVSVDPEGQTWFGKYASEKPAGGAIARSASKFDEPVMAEQEMM